MSIATSESASAIPIGLSASPTPPLNISIVASGSIDIDDVAEAEQPSLRGGMTGMEKDRSAGQSVRPDPDRSPADSMVGGDATSSNMGTGLAEASANTGVADSRGDTRDAAGAAVLSLLEFRLLGAGTTVM